MSPFSLVLSAKDSIFEVSVSPLYQRHYYLLLKSVYDLRMNFRQVMSIGQQTLAHLESDQSLARSVERLLRGSEANPIKF